MNVDLARIVARLGERPATILAPALAEPSLAKEAAILSYALGLIGPALDTLPGRLRRQAEDAAAILQRFDTASGAPAHAALLAEPSDDGRLSGMLARANALNAALIAVEDRLETTEAPWAAALRRDILATYVRWTGASTHPEPSS